MCVWIFFSSKITTIWLTFQKNKRGNNKGTKQERIKKAREAGREGREEGGGEERKEQKARKEMVYKGRFSELKSLHFM